MTSIPSLSGQLKLGDILAASGIDDLTEVLAIRHTAQADGIPDLSHATSEAVMAYTRDQDARFRVFPQQPPKLWLVFMDDGSYDGAHRSRFYGPLKTWARPWRSAPRRTAAST